MPSTVLTRLKQQAGIPKPPRMTLSREDLRNATTPYKQLGLPSDASLEHIRQAYMAKSLALNISPDDNPDSASHKILHALTKAKTILEDDADLKANLDDFGQSVRPLEDVHTSIHPVGMKQLLDECVVFSEARSNQYHPWAFLQIKEDASREEIEAAHAELRRKWLEYEEVAGLILACIDAAKETMLKQLPSEKKSRPRKGGRWC